MMILTILSCRNASIVSTSKPIIIPLEPRIAGSGALFVLTLYSLLQQLDITLFRKAIMDKDEIIAKLRTQCQVHFNKCNEMRAYYFQVGHCRSHLLGLAAGLFFFITMGFVIRTGSSNHIMAWIFMFGGLIASAWCIWETVFFYGPIGTIRQAFSMDEPFNAQRDPIEFTKEEWESQNPRRSHPEEEIYE